MGYNKYACRIHLHPRRDFDIITARFTKISMVSHRHENPLRSSLAAALISCADSPHRSQARRFVQGLSADELEFIAAFLGACMLDSCGNSCASQAEWAERVARYQQEPAARGSIRSDDREHKMILLVEYLCRSGVPRVALRAN